MVMVRGKKNLPPKNPHYFSVPIVGCEAPHQWDKKARVVREIPLPNITIKIKYIQSYSAFIRGTSAMSTACSVSASRVRIPPVR